MKPLKGVWLECQTAQDKAQGHKQNFMWKVLALPACVKGSVDTSDSFLEIEIKVKMLTDVQTDGQIDVYNQYISHSCLCNPAKNGITEYLID